MVLVFEEEVIKVICACAPQIKRSECEKDQFYNDIASKWDLPNLEVVFLVWETSTDMLGDELMVLRVCLVGAKLANEVLREENYLSFVMKRSCAWERQSLKRRSREK